jgi:sensor histidine kinase regulating citrate/malate metabolism
MDKIKLCSEIIKLIREQRHDFVNHFQVILGYLQLNKIEHAVSYIKQKNEEMQGSSFLSKLDNPYLAVVLMIALQKSQGMDIGLSFNIKQNVCFNENCPVFMVEELYFIINSALDFLDKTKDAERWMDVTLQESSQSIDWIITCSSPLIFEDLMHQLEGHPVQDGTPRCTIKGERQQHQTIINFQVFKE